VDERLVPVTIVKDVPIGDPLLDGELFGPILPIVPMKDFQAAIDYTNSRPTPMAIYVFTDDVKLKAKVLEETQSGAIDFNEVCFHMAVPGLPFGGVGNSGYGSHTGKFSFDTFTHLRSSVDNPRWVDWLIGWRFPPYTDAKAEQSKTVKAKIPYPRPGPGLAPVQAKGWFSWLW